MGDTVTKFKGPGQWRSQARRLERGDDTQPEPADDEELAPDGVEEFHLAGQHNQQTHGRALAASDVRKIKGASCSPSPCQHSETKHKNADGSWSNERVQVHEKIIASILDDIPKSASPTVYTLGGGGGSGKGYVQEKGIVTVPGKKSAAHINSDDIKEMLPEYDKLKGLKDRSAASYVHEESSYLAKEVLRRAQSKGVDVVMDQVGSNPLKMLKQIDQAEAAGYSVEAHYVTVPVETAIARAKSRGERTGRYVPESVLREAHRGATVAFQDLVKSGRLDKFSLTLNDGPEPTLLASGSGSDMKVHNNREYVNYQKRGQ